METPPATLAEVARMAGVSQATASRVLNGSDRVPKPALRERVVAAAARLSYTPNAAAQAIARGQTNTVGLIVNDISDPYFSIIAAGVMHAADDVGAVTMMSDARRDPERELELISALRRQRVRVIVLAGSRHKDRDLQRRLQREIDLFQGVGGRFALISQKLLAADTVSVDNRAGARALAGALVERGYRDVAILSGPPDLLTSADRVAGFRAGLARHGVDAARVVTAAFTRDGGAAAVTELLDTGPPPRLIFAVNDVMAVGAMAALRERGLRIPADVAVAGFDDIPSTRDSVPPLTTVRVDLAALGADALRLALEPADGTPRYRRARVEVMVRESTPPLRPAARSRSR